MKEGLLCGMIVGLVAGALLFKHSGAARDFVNKSENSIKKEVNELSKDLEKALKK